MPNKTEMIFKFKPKMNEIIKQSKCDPIFFIAKLNYNRLLVRFGNMLIQFLPFLYKNSNQIIPIFTKQYINLELQTKLLTK